MKKIKSNPMRTQIAKFDPKSRKSITAEVVIKSETGKKATFNLAIDTGAEPIILSDEFAEELLGYDLKLAKKKIIIDTIQKKSENVVMAKTVEVEGISMQNVDIVVKKMPEWLNIDGILGRRFFRGRLKLYFNFIEGEVYVEN